MKYGLVVWVLGLAALVALPHLGAFWAGFLVGAAAYVGGSGRK